MATNKNELAKEIDILLGQGGKVESLEQAAAARLRLATALADKIDAYVQYQIGARLDGILSAISVGSAPISATSGTTTSTSVAVPLIEGPGFSSLIRKK